MFVKSLYRKTAKMQNWFTDGTVPAFRLSRSLSFPSLLLSDYITGAPIFHTSAAFSPKSIIRFSRRFIISYFLT